jgi:DNA-binding NarL/FixJ family response regulator
VIETNGAPIFDGPGNFSGYMGFDRDVTERKSAMETLIKREEELEAKTVLLEEANTALKVLLKHREEGRRELEGMVLDNMKKLVFPYIEKLKNGHLNELQATCLNAIQSNLDSIMSPFQQRLTAANSFFTPTELQVADLIERGKTSKEIAKLLCVSKRTVDTHRDNIRGKLGLRSKKANLRAHLATLKNR